VDLEMTKGITYEEAFERLYKRKPTGKKEDISVVDISIKTDDLPF
jgi:hypothetical protein